MGEFAITDMKSFGELAVEYKILLDQKDSHLLTLSFQMSSELLKVQYQTKSCPQCFRKILSSNEHFYTLTFPSKLYKDN